MELIRSVLSYAVLFVVAFPMLAFVLVKLGCSKSVSAQTVEAALAKVNEKRQR